MIEIIRTTTAIRPRPHYYCVSCATEWPEHLMTRHGGDQSGKWVCCLCNSATHQKRVKTEKRRVARGHLHASVKGVFRLLTRVVLALALGAGLVYAGLTAVRSCQSWLESRTSSFAPKDASVAVARSGVLLQSGLAAVTNAGLEAGVPSSKRRSQTVKTPATRAVGVQRTRSAKARSDSREQA